MLSERSQKKGHIFYDSMYLKYPQRWIHRIRLQASGCQRLGVEAMGADCVMAVGFLDRPGGGSCELYSLKG